MKCKSTELVSLKLTNQLTGEVLGLDERTITGINLKVDIGIGLGLTYTNTQLYEGIDKFVKIQMYSRDMAGGTLSQCYDPYAYPPPPSRAFNNLVKLFRQKEYNQTAGENLFHPKRNFA